METAKVVFHNLTNLQAQTLAYWYDRQGEQEADAWFASIGAPVPFVDSQREGGGIVVEGNVVNVYTRSHV